MEVFPDKAYNSFGMMYFLSVIYNYRKISYFYSAIALKLVKKLIKYSGIV